MDLIIPKRIIHLEPGEKYAGDIQLESGVLEYGLIMAAVSPATSNWDSAMAWAKGNGWLLPTLQEIHLIMTNLLMRADFDHNIRMWTSDVSKADEDYAWSIRLRTLEETQELKYNQRLALAVRRV